MVAKSDAGQQGDSTDVMKRNDVPLSVVQNFGSIKDVAEWFASQGIVVSEGEEISDGFTLLDDKERLTRTPLIIIDWNYVESSDYPGRYFTTIRLMTQSGEKYRINDGSTGIHQQLQSVEEARIDAGNDNPRMGLLVKNGLRQSEYWISVDGTPMSEKQAAETPADEKRKARTYYLDF